MKPLFILVVSASAVLASCSKSSDRDSKAAPSPEEGAASPEKAAEGTSAEDTSPCDLLTEAILREHLELAADVEIDQDLSKTGGFPHCSYKWSKAVEGKAMKLNGSAHLTMTKEMNSEEAALGGLKSARTYLENRAKTQAEEKNVEFVSPFIDVEGVGAKAHYSTMQRQLSFVYGKRLFHLGVRPHAEGDAQELAKAIASVIAK